MSFWANIAEAQSLMPVQASDIATQVDNLYMFLVVASFISCVLVIGGFIYFGLRYKRQSANDKTAYISHNNVLEFLWSFIPFVIFMVVFGWGWYVFDKMREMPEDGLEVHVVGQKWSWNFVYKTGRSVPNEFYVPINKPVKLIITSKDVLHSVFIPAFRVKQDAVPGRYTSLWFEANKLGTFHIFCTEYCGDEHSSMLAKVHVLTDADYENWIKNDPYKGMSLAEIGQSVYSKVCVACHLTTNEKKIGPGFAGIFGKSRDFNSAGSVVADENYIRESILNPNAKIVKGYQKGLMQSYQGQLNENEILGIIEYFKTLK